MQAIITMCIIEATILFYLNIAIVAIIGSIEIV